MQRLILDKDIKPMYEHNWNGGWTYERRFTQEFTEYLESGENCDTCPAKSIKSYCEANGCIIIDDKYVRHGWGNYKVEGMDKLLGKHKVQRIFKVF